MSTATMSTPLARPSPRLGWRATARRPQILGIVGSLRRGSFNRRLLETAAALAPQGTDFRIHESLAMLPSFNEDIEPSAFAAGPVRQLREEVQSADALLIAPPEYNHSIPGVLKNAIDWLSRPLAGEVLVGKPVAVIGASSGSWGTRLAQAALRQALFATESHLITGPALYLARAEQAFDGEGRLTDETVRHTLGQIVKALVASRATAG
jgi:chromate reductase, NAD(P)H dehydrogenase (quinone)